MATPPEPNKAKTRELNEDALTNITKAKTILYQVLGESEPRKVQAVLRQVLPLLDDVAWSLNEVEFIHRDAMRRGSYNE